MKKTFMCGEVTERIKEIKDESVDLVVTDPPYNIGWKYAKGIHGVVDDRREDYDTWVAEWVKDGNVVTTLSNIAGIDIPVFKRVDFKEAEYDLFLTPLWTDIAIDKIRQLAVFLEEQKIMKAQIKILENELRITTQRVNLFEKVKIPDCRENIRLIRIYLGDQQANAVGRSKIAKSKIAEFVLEGAAL